MAVRIAAAAESDTTNMAKPARTGERQTSERSPTIRLLYCLDPLQQQNHATITIATRAAPEGEGVARSTVTTVTAKAKGLRVRRLTPHRRAEPLGQRGEATPQLRHSGYRKSDPA
jgi:hypothetical protein